MKKIAYFDCPSGISGDMCLGALLDAGVPLAYLHQQLSHLGLNQEFTLAAEDTVKQGQRAKQVQVMVTQSPFPAHAQGPSPLPEQFHTHHHPNPGAVPNPSLPLPHGDAAPSPAMAPGTPMRNLPAIEHLISRAALPPRVKHWSLAIFRRLGEAEAAVHGISIDQVHFHEVGATDAIVDIVGTCLGLDYLHIDTLICSPLPTGQGQVRAAHGWLPVPAPAVLKLMEMGQIPIYSNGLKGELVTPTGAAIVTILAQRFGPPPALTLEQVGLGAGQKDLSIANILRLWVGKETSPAPEPAFSSQTRPPVQSSEGQQHHAHSDGSMGQTLSLPPTPSSPETLPVAPTPSSPQGCPAGQETIVVLETQVDDLLPQAVGHLYDQLFAVGALDVFSQPVAMKKSRPGILITVLCRPEQQASCEMVLFAETTTLGIRHRRQERTVLRREFNSLQTGFGPVTLKLAYHPLTGQLMNAHPEYEDCAALARRHQVSWQSVYQAALAAWQHNPVECSGDGEVSSPS